VAYLASALVAVTGAVAVFLRRPATPNARSALLFGALGLPPKTSTLVLAVAAAIAAIVATNKLSDLGADREIGVWVLLLGYAAIVAAGWLPRAPQPIR
jgi:hypothetical protein